jgi:hypothetical protein
MKDDRSKDFGKKNILVINLLYYKFILNSQFVSILASLKFNWMYTTAAKVYLYQSNQGFLVARLVPQENVQLKRKVRSNENIAKMSLIFWKNK